MRKTCGNSPPKKEGVPGQALPNVQFPAKVAEPLHRIAVIS
jgi:hypothetical protein